jgi:hypothetical protein
MKRSGYWFLALAMVGAVAVCLPAQASVTEKVDAMIAENTAELKVRDADLSLQVGGPLILGVQFDGYANPHVAFGAGIGTFGNGTSLDISAKFYLLPDKFSPFLSLGGAYYFNDAEKNVFAVTGTAGLSYFFRSGLGLSLGWCYIRSVSQSSSPFSYQYVSDTINVGMPQFGIHWNY